MAKSVFRVFSTTAVIVGSFVGAGFASGRETLLFFRGCGAAWASVIFSILLFGVLSLLLHLCRETNARDVADYTERIAGRRIGKVYAVIFCINYFCTVTAMLAGAQSVLSAMFRVRAGFPWLALLTACVTYAIVIGGMKGLKGVNLLAVPLIIAFLVSLAVLPPAGDGNHGIAATSAQSFWYISMNCMILCGVLIGPAKTLSFAEGEAVAALSSGVLGVLIYFVLRVAGQVDLSVAEMPLLWLAEQTGVSDVRFGQVAVFLAIFTTLLSGAYPLQKACVRISADSRFRLAVILLAALIFSTLGFGRIIDVAYPLTGVVGGIFLLQSFWFYVKTKAARRKKRRAGIKTTELLR